MFFYQIPIIHSLEQRLINMYQKKANELISRRRQDVKDQMEELTPTSKLILPVVVLLLECRFL